MKSNLLADFLKTAREKKGLTQKEVAEELGYSHAQFISSWERGEREPPLNKFLQLISILGLKNEDVFEIMLKYRTEKIEAELREQFLKPRHRKSNRSV